ncbi:MAG: SDR family oxidoreductase [[Pasteurella] mairii]|uniref:Gluconate 5-dehydrogenase n=1 Tax=[Pasteurella] mairii TaxID=757 RepID=A0A379B7P6_9PAST|nr:SDR family oxidoreductase [[Pasteurella] mairii]SUB34663.1 gluconate 5-dehydrogenase [[Pasteurella] mairii]
MKILEKMRLDGKTAFVTGGARGIGKSVAIAFAQAGANVIIADFDFKEAEKTATEISSSEKATVIAVKTDVTDQVSVNNLMDIIKNRFNQLDIAFCNAGICMNIPAEDMTLAQWARVINVNLTGVFLTAQAAGKIMIEQGRGGSIINTASMSAHIVNVPQPQCAYNASKAGVIQLTKSLAIEWAKHNIRVNSLSPGYIGTDLTLNSKSLQPLIQEWNAMAPMHRLGSPEELQSICVYLAGDTSSFTSGADFIIDGAFSCF